MDFARNSIKGIVLVLVLALAATSAPAQDDADAEDTEDEETTLDRIIVTSERREQELQDYAGMVQAFSQEDLNKSGVGSEFNNLQYLIPGMNIANQEGNVEIFIRGVGSSNNTELGDPVSVTHINGVYVPRPRGIGAQFYDIERVEVHKGPQGTVRGRNAVGGTINIVTVQPKFDQVSGYLEAGFGNYDSRETQGAINLPAGSNAAFRFAAYSRVHDSHFNNAGLANHLTPAGEIDEWAARGSFRWEPGERLSIKLIADYTKEGGTGWPGANLFPAFTSVEEGLSFDDLEGSARDVIYRGHQGELDSENWGVQFNLQYDFDPFSVEYLASRRKVDFFQRNGTSDSVAFPGRDIGAVNYEVESGQWWESISESDIHELRFFAPDDHRLRWSAGAFYFQEDQEVGFLTTQDFGNFFSGVEFTMPDVESESYAFYADGVFDLTNRFRLKAGVRYTDEEKSRFGIGGNFAMGLGSEDFDCCFVTRFGTVGFIPNFLNRPTFDAPTTREEAIQFWLDAAAQFGLNDTFFEQLEGVLDGSMPNGTCIDSPDTNPDGSQTCPEDGQHSFFSFFPEQAAPSQQIGETSDSYYDWRAGFEYDFNPDHMLYGTVSTGHRSGGFNDTLPNIGSLTYDPESLVAYELGLRNRFSFATGQAILNAALFHYDYSDQVFQTLVAIGPGTEGDPPPQSLLNVNVADSKLWGAEMESSVELPAGFLLSANALWLDAEIDNGLIADFRAEDFGDPGNTPDADLSGNRLPHASKYNFIGRLQQVLPFAGGNFDWQILAHWRSDYFLSVFNQQDIMFRDGSVGDAIAAGFSDRQKGFWTVNIGAGWGNREDSIRLEGYVANLFDENSTQKALIGPNLNQRFLNQPRTYGVRLRYMF